MLSSITPLGQRSRGMSWVRTVAFFWIGAVSAGVLIFSLAGLVGSVAGLERYNPWLAGSAILAAAILDWVGVRPVGPRRQVNEDWLGRYRDWVVGLGFGAQLGVGVATIVPSWGMWALFVIALGTGPGVAAVIGAGFGIGRSLLLLATRRIRSTGALADAMRRFVSAESTAKWVAIAAYLVVIGVGVLDVY